MLCCPPEYAGTLRRDGQCDTKVFKVYFVIRFANYVLVDIIARECANSCSQVEGGANEARDAKKKLFGVSLKQILTCKNLCLRKKRCYGTAMDFMEIMI